MKLSDQERLELNELTNALVDGVISEAQRQRLEQLLANSADARRFYIRAMALSASLFDYASEMQSEAPDRPPVPANVALARFWRWAFGSIAATAMIALAFWGGVATKRGRNGETPGQETVAHLSGAKDCRWSGATLNPGTELQSGQRLELAAGWAEITFDSGAQLILEGPASLDVHSAWEAVLHRGALKANVSPEAIGFRIGNAAVDVIDLGTEFSMVADENGATEVFVLKGAVEAKPRTSVSDTSRQSVVLHEKQSRRFAHNGVSDVLNSEQKFQRLLRKVSLDAFVKPATYVHWSFDENDGPRAVADIVGKPAREFDAQLHPAIPPATASSRVEGLWQRALNCDGQISAHAALPSFTLRTSSTVAFWVRVPSDATVADSEAMLTWPLPSTGRSVEVSWNRVPTEGAFGALRANLDQNHIIATTSLRDGQWHHVAIVFNSPPHAPQKLQIKQYVDGRLDKASAKHAVKRVNSSATTPRHASVRETLWIGRGVNDSGKAGFRGAIDELFLVDRALSQKEIRMLMTQNRLPSPEVLVAK